MEPTGFGVKATRIDWSEPTMYIKNDRWHGPPGALLRYDSGFLMCCPKCCELGSPKDGAKWTTVEGSFEDVSNLTLSPSIAKSCCGWHGYLVKGTFCATPNGGM
jgi:hypothetical protein